MADNDRASGRRLDGVAVDRALRRLAAEPEPPWLHREVARRLAERLAPMRAQPLRILDWWAGVGGGASVLRARYPKAKVVAVEADARWHGSRAGAARRSWWPFGGSAASALLATDDDALLGRAQLVWANMVLHGVADPPALFGRWQGLLEVDGLVVFSCLGPGTLQGLRDLYASEGWPAPTPGFIDMHDLGDMLVEAGFADPVLDQETLMLSWAERRGASRGAASARRQRSPRAFSWPCARLRGGGDFCRRSRLARPATAGSRCSSRLPTAMPSRRRRACGRASR